MAQTLIEPSGQTEAHAGGAERHDKWISGKGIENERAGLRIMVRTDEFIMLRDIQMFPQASLIQAASVKLHLRLLIGETFD
jgi:hypothetical protein